MRSARGVFGEKKLLRNISYTRATVQAGEPMTVK
jgi:hypothetical protein